MLMYCFLKFYFLQINIILYLYKYNNNKTYDCMNYNII